MVANADAVGLWNDGEQVIAFWKIINDILGDDDFALSDRDAFVDSVVVESFLGELLDFFEVFNSIMAPANLLMLSLCHNQICVFQRQKYYELRAIAFFRILFFLSNSPPSEVLFQISAQGADLILVDSGKDQSEVVPDLDLELELVQVRGWRRWHIFLNWNQLKNY